MTAKPAKKIRSRMGRSTVDKIWVQGRDLPGELLGQLDLGAMAWLEITGRLPSAPEAKMFNALLLTLVEHGLTPNAIATRLTYLGAPESLQAAVAAGLCGMGTRFAGTAEGAARVLQVALAEGGAVDISQTARVIVADHLARKAPVPGIGHPQHKPIDPRTPVLFRLAQETGFSGRHVELIQAVSAEAERATGKSLPVNATGAIGAIASEMGLDWRLCRGIAVIGRAVGLVGHIAEELRDPIASQIWLQAEAEASAEAESSQ